MKIAVKKDRPKPTKPLTDAQKEILKKVSNQAFSAAKQIKDQGL